MSNIKHSVSNVTVVLDCGICGKLKQDTDLRMDVRAMTDVQGAIKILEKYFPDVAGHAATEIFTQYGGRLYICEECSKKNENSMRMNNKGEIENVKN